MIMEAPAEFTFILVAITATTMMEAAMATHTKAAVPRKTIAVSVDKTRSSEEEE